MLTHQRSQYEAHLGEKTNASNHHAVFSLSHLISPNIYHLCLIYVYMPVSISISLLSAS